MLKGIKKIIFTAVLFIVGYFIYNNTHSLSILDTENLEMKISVKIKTPIKVVSEPSQPKLIEKSPQPALEAHQSLAPESVSAQASLLGHGIGSVFGSGGPGIAGGGVGGEGFLSQVARSITQDVKVLSRGILDYPIEAKNKGLTGYVTCRILVLEDGSMQQIQIVESQPPGIFDKSVLQFVRSWKFSPSVESGKPVSQWTTQRLRFSLE